MRAEVVHGSSSSRKHFFDDFDSGLAQEIFRGLPADQHEGVIVGEINLVGVARQRDGIGPDLLDFGLQQLLDSSFARGRRQKLPVSVLGSLESVTSVAQRNLIGSGTAERQRCLDGGIPATHYQKILVLVSLSFDEAVGNFRQVLSGD